AARSTSLTSHPGGNEQRGHPPEPPKSIRNMGFLWLLPALPVLLLAFVGLRYLVRGTPVTRVRGGRRPYAAPGLPAERLVQSLQLHTKSGLDSGHRVDVRRCGDDLYPLRWEDLRSAQRSITLQLYYCKPGRMANARLEIRCDRAAAGVRILFLQDAYGSP